MSEGEVKKEIIAYLKKAGIHHNNILQGRIGSYGNVKGISDILCCYRGRYVAIEVKGKGGRASADQLEFLESVNLSGGVAFLAYSLDDVLEKLRGIK